MEDAGWDGREQPRAVLDLYKVEYGWRSKRDEGGVGEVGEEYYGEARGEVYDEDAC